MLVAANTACDKILTMEQKHTVYCVTCLVNGKRYVGRTSKDPSQRWAEHVRNVRRAKTLLSRAIIKYGKDAFVVATLEVTTADKIYERETHWIKQFDTRNRDTGYNVAIGGSGAAHVKGSTREKLSLKSRQYWSGIEKSERSAMLRKRTIGFKKSKEHCANLSRAKAGRSSAKIKTSAFIGVCRRKRKRPSQWDAVCYKHCQPFSRACMTELEAAECYDKMSLFLHGEETPLNFPQTGNSNSRLP